MSQGLIMKVLTSWKKIQLCAKRGGAAGIISSRYKQRFVLNSINIYDFTWHNANVRIITVKSYGNH